MTEGDVLEFLGLFADYEKDRSFSYPEALSLDRMRRLCREFAYPQNTFDSVIIAGSKGKGSAAVMLASILRMDDFKVGLYTSPHLLDVRERIRVNNLPISPARLIEAAEKLRKILNTSEWRREPPTYFELLTVIAFWHFREMKVQVAVLEVGLGGLYDSTNVVPAKAAGLTALSLEHTDKLGKTVAKITIQKCGIIKGREVVVSAPQIREAEEVIEETANERECVLWRVGREIRFAERGHDEEGQGFDLEGPFGKLYGLKISLLGLHQIENACVAVGLAKALEKKTRLKISDVAVKQGLVDAVWPGRLEKISNQPLTILDGAHNSESMRRALEALHRHFHFSSIRMVLALAKDKDAAAILESLQGEVSKMWVTTFPGDRALGAAELGRLAKSSFPEVEVEESPVTALEKASQGAGPGELVFIAGSLYLVAEIHRGRRL